MWHGGAQGLQMRVRKSAVNVEWESSLACFTHRDHMKIVGRERDQIEMESEPKTGAAIVR